MQIPNSIILQFDPSPSISILPGAFHKIKLENNAAVTMVKLLGP